MRAPVHGGSRDCLTRELQRKQHPQVFSSELLAGQPHRVRRWPGNSRRRDFEVLSTLPSSPTSLPSWKQEVNRRLAEHKNRKGISVVDKNAEEGQGTGNSRAAAAAARVAARYAKAPSYSEMQAAEARAALRAAEAATRAALHAQVAAQAALKNLEASDEEYKVEERAHQARSIQAEESQSRQAWENTGQSPAVAGSFELRWEPDLPVQT